MTANQKQQVLELWQQGLSFSKIAETIGVPKNTVKTLCWRNRNLQADAFPESVIEGDQDVCRQCGQPLKQQPKQKPRRFCGDQCRKDWWRENRDQLNRKALYKIVCAHCGNAFESYGNNDRQYCCHSCYISARFRSERKGETI